MKFRAALNGGTAKTLHAWPPLAEKRLQIEEDNVTVQNEKQIIISSFKASISAILCEHWKIAHLVICPFDYGC